MPKFFIALAGAGDGETEGDYASVDEARNAAISLLGGHLQRHPAYASERHWRAEVRDHAHRLLVHVVVATVEAAPPINWRSFES